MPMNCEHLPEHAKLELTPQLIHHGKWVCSACGKFLGWESKPATKDRLAENLKKLEHCRNGNGLTEWEKQFVAGLSERLSPKQQAVIDRIAKETGYAG